MKTREQELHEATVRGREFKDLAESPRLKEAFEHVRSQLRQKWEHNAQIGQQGREHAWLLLGIVGEAEKYINDAILHGEESAVLLKEEQKRSRFQIFNNR